MYCLDDQRLLRNATDRLAYASMDPVKKSEIVYKQRNKRSQKRKRTASCSSRSDSMDVASGIYQTMVNSICFELHLLCFTMSCFC